MTEWRVLHETDYYTAVAAYMKRVEEEHPGTMVLQPSRRLSRFVGGNWYFRNVNGYLGRIGVGEVVTRPGGEA